MKPQIIPTNYQQWVNQGKIHNPALLSFMVWDYQKHKWVEAGFKPLFKVKPN